MSLSELEFALFLPVVFATYWVLPRRAAVQNAVLLGASYVFYATWSWRLLWVVMTGTAVDWIVARRLSDERTSPTLRRRWLWCSVGASTLTLVAFKYELFVAGSLNELLRRVGLPGALPLLSLGVPIGISFYTLQRIGFIVDLYWGRADAPRSRLAFALFCCYFPQLTAGPIARGTELLTQLESVRRWSAEALTRGGGAFATGLALKAWAADAIGTQWVAPVFAQSDAWGAAAHACALVGFLLQVFGDFAGYSAMACGVSWWFGIALPENFNRPLLSTSLPELWRRWHISLNRWLFDYVFTPATTGGGPLHARVGTGLLVTFLVSGVWHGAAWTFVVWGALHGMGMVTHQAWDGFCRRLSRRNRRLVAIRASRAYGAAAWAATMTFFLVTLIPFRAGSLSAAWAFGRGLLGAAGNRPPEVGELSGLSALLGVAFIVAYHVVGWPPFAPIRRAWADTSPAVRGVAYGLAVVLLIIVMPVGSGAFIYQQY